MPPKLFNNLLLFIFCLRGQLHRSIKMPFILLQGGNLIPFKGSKNMGPYCAAGKSCDQLPYHSSHISNRGFIGMKRAVQSLTKSSFYPQVENYACLLNLAWTQGIFSPSLGVRTDFSGWTRKPNLVRVSVVAVITASVHSLSLPIIMVSSRYPTITWPACLREARTCLRKLVNSLGAVLRPLGRA